MTMLEMKINSLEPSNTLVPVQGIAHDKSHQGGKNDLIKQIALKAIKNGVIDRCALIVRKPKNSVVKSDDRVAFDETFRKIAKKKQPHIVKLKAEGKLLHSKFNDGTKVYDYLTSQGIRRAIVRNNEIEEYHRYVMVIKDGKFLLDPDYANKYHLTTLEEFFSEIDEGLNILIYLPGILKNLLVELEYCHKRGISFVQVSPLNISVYTGSDKPNLSLFHTKEKSFRNYLSPEQFKGKEKTEKSDIYGLGLILAELLNEEQPLSCYFIYTIHLLASLKKLLEDRKDKAEIETAVFPCRDKPWRGIRSDMDFYTFFDLKDFLKQFKEGLDKNKTTFEKLLSVGTLGWEEEMLDWLSITTNSFLKELSEKERSDKKLLDVVTDIEEVMKNRLDEIWANIEKHADDYKNAAFKTSSEQKSQYYHTEIFLRRICLLMLQPDPDKRPSASELLKLFGDDLTKLAEKE